MCLTPTPIYKKRKLIMKHLVDQRQELVKKDIKRFKDKGYMVYYAAIPKKEYDSPMFMGYAANIILEAKKSSKGYSYNGIAVFLPFIDYQKFTYLLNRYIKTEKKPKILQIYNFLFDCCTHFNKNKCLNDVISNDTGKKCKDTDIHIMIFYFKGGLNWK